MNWNKKSKVIVQGITENLGLYHSKKMKGYGVNIVAGISPGRKGQVFDEIPLFNLVEEAVSEVGEIQTSIIFLPPYQVLDGAWEAMAAGVKEIIIITAGVPPLDMLKLVKKAEETNTLIVGPGSGGIIIPETILLGTIEPKFYQPGSVALLSRSETLNHEIALHLNQAGLGEAIAVSLGNQRIIGSSLSQWLKILTSVPNISVIVLSLSPEDAEQLSAELREYSKPLIAYVYGIYSSQENFFASAKTIIANRLSSGAEVSIPVKDKSAPLAFAKVTIAKNLEQIASLVKKQKHS